MERDGHSLVKLVIVGSMIYANVLGLSAAGWQGWAVDSVLFLPGGVAGWLLARPVNRGLGAFFRGFNWAFDRGTNAYGFAVALFLRVSVIILLARSRSPLSSKEIMPPAAAIWPLAISWPGWWARPG